MAKNVLPSLSIVIPSFQAQEHMGRCLDALTSQLDGVTAEIIVVDCSPHNEVEQICARYPAVRLIKRIERFNPGGGRNIGAEAATGDYLLFIDADVLLQPGSLQAIAERAAAGHKIFGGALDLERSVPLSFASWVEHYYFNHEAHSTRMPGQRPNLSSALMIVERALFLEIGGFSQIPRMQDTELTERLVKRGCKLGFFPEIIGGQIQDSPLSKVMRKIFITGNNLYFIRYQKSCGWLQRLSLILLLPLMMLAKITRINLRNLRYAFSGRMLLLLCPFMYVCGIAWMAGFYRALFAGGGIASGR